MVITLITFFFHCIRTKNGDTDRLNENIVNNFSNAITKRIVFTKQLIISNGYIFLKRQRIIYEYGL